jgi:hypothetical protein
MEQPDREATFLEIPSAVPSPGEFVAAPRLAAIHFEYGASEIRSEDVAVLDENAAWLKANPNTLVLIEGHSDASRPAGSSRSPTARSTRSAPTTTRPAGRRTAGPSSSSCRSSRIDSPALRIGDEAGTRRRRLYARIPVTMRRT